MQDDQRFTTSFRLGSNGQEFDIPYRAKNGGVFITIRDADNHMLGEVQITAANVYWRKPRRAWRRLTSEVFCQLLDTNAQ